MKKNYNCGSYTNIQEMGDYIVKRIPLKEVSKHQKEVLLHTQKSVEDIIKYQKLLKDCNFPFEPAQNIKFYDGYIEYSQRVIHSENVDDMLISLYQNYENNANKIIKIYDDVINLWELSHRQSDVYVDFNLRNFVYDDNKLTLIDLFPTIIEENIDRNSTNINVIRQIDLWTDKYVNLGSMMCYFVQPLVDLNEEGGKSKIKHIFEYMLKLTYEKTGLSVAQILDNLQGKSHPFAKRFINLCNYLFNENTEDDTFSKKFYENYFSI